MGLDVTFHTQSPDTDLHVTVLAPILRATIPIGSWTLEPDLPFLYYDVSTPSGAASFLGTSGDSGFVAGNPTFAAKYHAISNGIDAHVGAGVALPLASLSRTDASILWKAAGYTATLGTRGIWNVWWYYPDALTLFLPFGIRYVGDQGLDVGAEAAVGVLMYTGSGSQDPRGALQIGAHVGYASSSVEAGLRLQGVRIPGDSANDQFQSSLEPYVRALLDHAFFGAGFLVNLDEPFGPLLDAGKVWGLRLEGGARL